VGTTVKNVLAIKDQKLSHSTANTAILQFLSLHHWAVVEIICSQKLTRDRRTKKLQDLQVFSTKLWDCCNYEIGILSVVEIKVLIDE
jgi:hypothetical protein